MYAKKRYLSFFIITCIAMFLPFFKVNDNHLFLLNFDQKELNLFFIKFDMQELYLMPFVFIILFLFIFFMTTLGGRVWCGWSCPQTIFRTFYRDLLQTKLLKIRKNVKNKQQDTQNGIKSIVAIVIWTCVSFIIACNFMLYFIPSDYFLDYLLNPSEHKVLIGILAIITSWLVFDIAFLAEKFCIYICPYARIQSVMFDNDTMQVIYNEKRGGKIFDGAVKLWKKPPNEIDECTGCESCVKICPTHIDIRRGMQLDCINCLECIDACSSVMQKLGKTSLITWTSQNATQNNTKVKFARFRTIAYCVVLTIACVVLFLMSGKKENMLLNINRTSELYKIVDNNIVENYYVFLFQNTDKKDHSYFFDTNNTNIKILSPKKPFGIKAGYKKKIIVTLASENLNQNSTKDIPTKIKIKAFADDSKDLINVDRDTIFVYPKKIR
ncbi:cytochrome c oxidase accessory protein [Campylobacter pinnipediorum subsp. caledonicus]|uniref:Cytochrome c oxidase accessory protein n=1 Tax=Campylobacter pinnipediorum subsp. caledonicus TaxID=1874362 RepID=A0A1S6U693_9BACT|nr:cytochrome c oxidase accessory protein CcoG [Campylobacter pinnipediorum]AQW85658.1 cytochrome c oxidase accessory protein [Campylobacter pinnipediorum subsp. caledonicus]AQW87268.1 cytochrome c oxidase accessory protein [Campylobacter pinnipediorum subsp. caledonicus]OPA71800.1 cytochrome c oxidase accessory protein CcoG [Campylobacter pinnipediorum subsp. caledonicus]